MAAKNLPSKRRTTQPQVQIISYPDSVARLLELAEKRGYSAKALTALALSALMAHQANRRPAPRRRKAA